MSIGLTNTKLIINGEKKRIIFFTHFFDFEKLCVVCGMHKDDAPLGSNVILILVAAP